MGTFSKKRPSGREILIFGMSFPIPCDLLDHPVVVNYSFPMQMWGININSVYLVQIISFVRKPTPFGWRFEPPMGNASIICSREEKKIQNQKNHSIPERCPFPSMKCTLVHGNTTMRKIARSPTSN